MYKIVQAAAVIPEKDQNERFETPKMYPDGCYR